MGNRYVLRRSDPTASTVEAVRAQLGQRTDLRILTETPYALFVEMSDGAFRTDPGQMPGWTVTAESRTPVPTTRPSIARPPRI